MKTHLKGLDTLRAVAALIVVWSHIEIVKQMYNLPPVTLSFLPNAHFSVTLFFVLSGFLITYLLVKEKDKYNTISFKNFYIRRILRIWPLYYLILFLSYFFIDSNVSTRTLILCLLVFPNVPLALKAKWTGSPHVWSIGVEEQFYMFWPLIIFLTPKKKMLVTLIIFCVGITILPYAINYLNIKTIYNQKVHSFVEKFFYYTKFNCMALGGIFGYAVATDQKWLKVFYKNVFVVLFFIVLAFEVWFSGASFGRFSDEVYSLFFAIMIVGLVKNQRINIDTKVTSFLGKISYGLYMYHWMITIGIVSLLMKYKNIDHFNLFLYTSVFASSILVSWISYITFERYFLNLKKKFEV